MALRIQDADRIPGPIEFELVYEHEITALEDGVELWESEEGRISTYLLGQEPPRKVLRKLNKGESIRGQVTKESDFNMLARAITGEKLPPATLRVTVIRERLYGKVYADKVEVKCVPRDTRFVKEYFPNLPQLEYAK